MTWVRLAVFFYGLFVAFFFFACLGAVLAHFALPMPWQLTIGVGYWCVASPVAAFFAKIYR